LFERRLVSFESAEERLTAIRRIARSCANPVEACMAARVEVLENMPAWLTISGIRAQKARNIMFHPQK
jgi:hypothetical protein